MVDRNRKKGANFLVTLECSLKEILQQSSIVCLDRNDDVNFQGDGALKEFFYRQFLSSVGPREDNRVDKHSFQLLLWKTMAKFPEIVEPRSRQVVPLFLDFFR